MSLTITLKNLLDQSARLQVEHATKVTNQAICATGATVTAGEAQPPRVMQSAGPAGVSSPAAVDADPMASLSEGIKKLRTQVEDFRAKVAALYADQGNAGQSIPKREMDALLEGWSRLDADLDKLLAADKGRLNDAGYQLRAQDTLAFLERHVERHGLTEKQLLSAMPHSPDVSKAMLAKMSLADRLDGMTVEEATRWVNEARQQAPAAGPAGDAQTVEFADTHVLSADHIRKWFPGTNAGKAVISDPSFKSVLLHKLREITNRTGVGIEDIFTGMEVWRARDYLKTALEMLNLTVEVEANQQDQVNVEAMVQALDVEPLGVNGDGNCLYYALAKSADPRSIDDPEAAKKMRKKLDEDASTLAGSGNLKKLGITSQEDYANSPARSYIKAGLESAPLDSRAWGGPQEMRIYAIANHRTVAFVSTNGGYLYTPDGEKHHIKNPAAFRQELDIQAADDKAKGHKPPLIVINRSDTHFEAAVYAEKPAATPASGGPQASVKSGESRMVPEELVKHQAVIKLFMEFVNQSRGYADSHPQALAKQREIAWRSLSERSETVGSARIDKAKTEYVDAYANQGRPASPAPAALMVARANLPSESRDRMLALAKAFDAVESCLLDMQLADCRTTADKHPIKSLMEPSTGTASLVQDLRRSFGSSLAMNTADVMKSLHDGKNEQLYGVLGDFGRKQEQQIQRLDQEIVKLQAALDLDDARFFPQLDGDSRLGIQNMIAALKMLKAEAVHPDGVVQATQNVFNAVADGRYGSLTMVV